MKKKYRFISIILTFAMIFSLLSMNLIISSAEENDTITTDTIDTTDYLPIDSSFTGGTLKSGKYLITDDINLKKNITIPKGEDVTICLNGCDINVEKYGVICKGILNIENNNKSGTLSAGDNSKYAVKVEKDGTLNLNSGTIAIENSKTSESYSAIELSGTMNMNGGKVVGAGELNNGIILNDSKSTLNLTNGLISGKNNAVSESGGTVNMSGGTLFESNCGIEISKGTMNMNGGIIENCELGVWLEDQMEMTGGEIKNCSFSGINYIDNSKLSLGGNAVISKNKENVYVEYSKVITISNSVLPTKDMSIGITSYSRPYYSIEDSIEITDDTAGNYLVNFFSDDSSCYLKNNNGIISMYSRIVDYPSASNDYKFDLITDDYNKSPKSVQYNWFPYNVKEISKENNFIYKNEESKGILNEDQSSWSLHIPEENVENEEAVDVFCVKMPENSKIAFKAEVENAELITINIGTVENHNEIFGSSELIDTESNDRSVDFEYTVEEAGDYYISISVYGNQNEYDATIDNINLYTIDEKGLINNIGNSLLNKGEKGKLYFCKALLKDGNKVDYEINSESFVYLGNAAEIANMNFIDVKESDYFYNPVLWATAAEITLGTDSTHFSPNKNCTRAEIITFMWRLASMPESDAKICFKDVKEGSYYEKAVKWAIENGITQGTSENTFSPNELVTRGQTALFIYRMSEAPLINEEINFKDVQNDSYYYDAVKWASHAGITNGTSSDKFSPNAYCTRAQIVTFLYRDFIYILESIFNDFDLDTEE